MVAKKRAMGWTKTGDGEEELDGEDGVDLKDEGPTEFGALKHHQVEWAVAKIGLQVGILPHRTPHADDRSLLMGSQEQIVCKYLG